MLCDKYKDALIEAAAGDALPTSLGEHVNRCPDCRATLDAQQTIFTVIDAGLRSRTNVTVPANFGHRVRAALEVSISPKGRRYSSVFAFGSMAAAAAMGLAMLLTHNWNHSRIERLPSSVEQAELRVPPSPAKRGNDKDIQPFSREASHSPSSGLNVRRRSSGTALGDKGVEVLVPEGQEELLVKYMEGVAARRPRITTGAGLQREPDMKPVQVLPIEISELVVKPLPDLSSN